jgi:hypothetical protein
LPAGAGDFAGACRHELQTARFDGSTGPRKVGPADGKLVDIQSVGVRFMAWSEETGGGFSLVEHPIPPHGLVAPMHRHSREDEYSYVLEGGWALGSVTTWPLRTPETSSSSTQPVAHLLERRRSALQGSRDHLPRGIGALLRRAGGGDGLS